MNLHTTSNSFDKLNTDFVSDHSINKNTTLKNLRKLPDSELLLRTDLLVEKERSTTLEVLQHLREVEIRRLFIECGYASMHAMCIKRYKYSDGQAQRRLASARLLTELPEIEDKIQDGSLNITTLSKVQSFIRAEKKAQHPLSKQDKLELLEELENKSTREAERELVKQSHQPELLMTQFKMNPTNPQMDSVNQNTENYLKFEALLNEENQKLLAEVKDLFAQELQSMDALSILELLLKKVTAQKKKKLGLGEKHNASPPLAPHVNKSKDKVKPQRQVISVKTTRALWQRAQSCCEHMDPFTKKRCSSKHALQQDHIKPVALGGDNSLGNLALHCRAHNSRRAVKTFGVFKQT